MRSVVALVGSLALLGALLAVAPAVLAGGGCHAAGAGRDVPVSGSAAVVGMEGCTFLPTINRVPVGTEVTFENTSFTYHDVTGTMWAWRSPTLQAGAGYTRRFTEPGIYPYSCSLHPGMAGVIEVVAPDLALASDVTPSGGGGETAGRGSLGAAAVGLVLGALGAAVVARRRTASSG